MKEKRRLRGWMHFAALAFVLMAAGVRRGLIAFGELEQLTLCQPEQTALLRASVLSAMASGGLTAAGVGILVLTALHMLRRTARLQKETEALRSRTEALEGYNSELRQMAHHQRLETIGTLTASIAHEFNNLLTPIMGYSMMALEKLPPEETELYDDLLEVYNTSARAKKIITQLSDLSRKGSDSCIRQVSPDELIHRTLTVASPAKPEGVQVRLDLNCWDQRLRGNEIQLSQMLLNLILNAFHAMESGGDLDIQTTFDDQFVHIRIRDTGCGIPQELQSRVFEPFFTTREAGKGTGLGLAIVAQVVESHQGRVKLESAPGKGTEFLVSLPRNDN